MNDSGTNIHIKHERSVFHQVILERVEQVETRRAAELFGPKFLLCNLQLTTFYRDL